MAKTSKVAQRPVAGELSTLASVPGVVILSQPRDNEGCYNQNRNHPPEPCDSARLRTWFPELLFDEPVVIKLFRGQIQIPLLRFLGPSGFLIRAALGAGLRSTRHIRPTIGTCFRGLRADSVKRLHVSDPGSEYRPYTGSTHSVIPCRHIPRPSSGSRPSGCNREKWPACLSRILPAARDY